MNKSKRIIIGMVALVLIIAGGLFARYMLSVNSYQNKVKELEFSSVDISQIPDGTYTGECDVDFISAKVQVTVAGGRLKEVKLLKHKTERGQSAEVIINDVVEQNTLDVDSVSGATNSSKVIKKAVENALLGEKN